MPNSQSHRPAISIRSSPSIRMKKLLDRASSLEQQLSGQAKPNDEKAASLRSHLCEVLSDLLISNPVLAAEYDCSGRLWRSCFYAPIGVWRSRIAREKRKQGPNLSSLDQSFQRFLGESVTLYDYLVLQYQAKLMPTSSQVSSKGNTQGSQLSEAPASVEGVVQGLYKLYIHMGDLHRYGEAYGKAEVCYMNASKIAPGMGNPYNQLAVVAQMKDANLSCVALYWYARSLLATHDSFPTSGNNLERLFSINRDYLKNHSRDLHPTILPAINNKTSADLIRPQKAAATKSCLAHFVDFHFELLKNQNADSETEKLLKEKLEAFQKSLQSLLLASAFGDALLCKMVVIAAFAQDMNRESAITLNRYLSEDLVFTLGTALGERLHHGLLKIVDKSERLPGTIRLLLPFLLLCDYVQQLNSKFETPASISFWTQCALVGNLTQQLYKRFGLSFPTQAAESSWVSIKEYNSLRGFRPFTFLNTDYMKQGPYLSSAEAVEILDLNPSQSHQSASSGPKETAAKLVRLNHFIHECAKNEGFPVCHVGDVFKFDVLKCGRSNQDCGGSDSKVEENVGRNSDLPLRKVMTLEEGKYKGGGDSATAEDQLRPGKDQDGAGDLVVYNSSEKGGAPELLLPGMLSNPLQSTNVFKDTSASNIQAAMRSSCVDGEIEGAGNHSQPGLHRPPPGITPPPGFGVPITQATNAAPIEQVFDGKIHSGVSEYLLVQETTRPFHHATSSVPVAADLTLHPPASFAGQTLGAAGNRDWFQALQTTNPFVSTAHSQPTARPPQDPGGEPDATAIDGAALLGSGFLDSLWTNDTVGNQTKNPFATNKGRL